MGNLREHDVHSAVMAQLGFVPGAIHYAAKSSAVPYGFLRDDRRIPASKLHTSIVDAYNAAGVQNGNNNVIVLTPDSHSQAAKLTFNKNMTHLVGAFPAGMYGQRARIGMSTAFTPMIEVSGYGNFFRNLYTMHGTAAADYVGWLISGHRNVFRNVYFGGPFVAAQGGHASYVGVHVTGIQNYFKDCVFGSNSIGRDEITPNLLLGAGSGDNVFENCIFNCYLTDGDPVFIKVLNTDTTHATFKNCMFIALSANWATPMTVAFLFTAGSTAGLYFDNNCQFINVTALVASDKDQYVWLPRQYVSTTDTDGMRSVQLAI